LSESQQLDFIKRINIHDFPPNDIYILEENPFQLPLNIDCIRFLKHR
jgi:hypothetical protein